MLETLPLLGPLFCVLHARRYTFEWSSMLALACLAEGVVRATTDSGLSRWFAAGDIALSLAHFLASACYARATRPA